MSNQNNGDMNPNQGFYPYQMGHPGVMHDQMRHPHPIAPPMQNQHFMNPAMNMDPEGSASNDPRRQYKKKKSWFWTLNITIETPSLDNQFNESFEIEIGSNQRLKILQDTIVAKVSNQKVRDLFRDDKMFIYIDGKKPVHRKSKSLQEMGVQDGNNLICTTEMRIPFHDNMSDDEEAPGMYRPRENDEMYESMQQRMPN